MPLPGPNASRQRPVHPLARQWPLLLLVVLLLTACGGPGDQRNLATEVISITPTRAPVGGGTIIRVEGSGFVQPRGGRQLRAEVCGTPLRDVRVIGERKQVILPPAASVTATVGDALEGTTSPGGQVGLSDLLVITADGQRITLEGAFECFEPAATIAGFQVEEAGLVGQPTRFTWKITHDTEGEPLECTLDPGDGTEAHEVSDCHEATGTSHTYREGGSMTVVLTVTDTSGRQSTKAIDYVVGHPPPDANDDELTLSALDLPITIGATALLANDEGEGLAITGVNGNQHVTWDETTQTITYDPGDEFDRLPSGESALDTFTYTLADVRGATAEAIVTLTIAGADRVLALTIDEIDLKRVIGEEFTLTTTLDATGDADQGVTWQSSNETVATIDATGTLTTHATGTTTITATSRHDPTINDSITLTVERGLELTIDTNEADGTRFQLHLTGTGTVRIAWGDGTVETVTDPDGPSHQYASEGTYTIRVTGTLTDEPRFGHDDPYSHNPQMITSLASWGDLGLTNLNGAFNNASNLTSVPNTVPNGVTDMSWMFYNARSFNGDISGWNTSKVKIMSTKFKGASR